MTRPAVGPQRPCTPSRLSTISWKSWRLETSPKGGGGPIQPQGAMLRDTGRNKSIRARTFAPPATFDGRLSPFTHLRLETLNTASSKTAPSGAITGERSHEVSCVGRYPVRGISPFPPWNSLIHDNASRKARLESRSQPGESETESDERPRFVPSRPPLHTHPHHKEIASIGKEQPLPPGSISQGQTSQSAASQLSQTPTACRDAGDGQGRLRSVSGWLRATCADL